MPFNLRQADLAKLNTLTKYPSIPTYHSLDPTNGGLLDEHIDFSGGIVVATEKIDGTNARIILLPDGNYLLGSREELLYAKGDLIENPALGIVETLKPVAERMGDHAGRMIVCYLEVYGGRVTGASRQYTGNATLGYRLFDLLDIDRYEPILAMSRGEISALRDSPSGAGTFRSESDLADFSSREQIPLVPRLQTPGTNIPASIEETYEYLRQTIPATRSALDAAAGMKPEGIVVRTPDRSRIAKIRFQDYERTLKRRKQL